MFTPKEESIFNTELFPTPDEVIALMVEPWVEDYKGKKYLKFSSKLLDPSAGLGNILDHVSKRFSTYSRRINAFAVEINDQACAILQSKGYTVLDSDFLAFDGDGHNFSMILMNPPFSAGAKHLLHAWNVVASGGTKIACLLNAETLKNPHTKERQLLLEIINQHGTWRSIGQAFKDSERQTDVEVALVHLTKPEEKESVNFGDGYDVESATAEFLQFGTNMPAHNNPMSAVVARYDAAVLTIREMYELNSKLEFYTEMKYQGSTGHTHTSKVSIRDLCSANGHNDIRPMNEAIQAVKKLYWTAFFRGTNLEQFMTTKVREEFDRFIEDNRNLAFTEDNILRVRDTIRASSDEIVKSCFLSTFDTFTQFHDKNKVHVEGWKTNSAWKLNKKIIYPRAIDNSWDSFHLGYGNDKPLNDVDLLMCRLTGTAVNSITRLSDAIKDHCSNYQKERLRHDEKRESTFFYFRCYKKGTIHLWPKDLNAWNDFNITVARYRNWIGDGS